jgi:hypothetical protein
LLPCIARRKPIGDLCKGRFCVADGFGQRRSASGKPFLLFEKTATDLETKSGKSFASGGSPTTAVRPASTVVGAASTNTGAAGTAASRADTLVSELIGGSSPSADCYGDDGGWHSATKLLIGNERFERRSAAFTFPVKMLCYLFTDDPRHRSKQKPLYGPQTHPVPRRILLKFKFFPEVRDVVSTSQTLFVTVC